MRQRSIFAIGLATSLTALAGGTLLGCEDGPSQTFTPAPANAGNLWNNGNPDASVTSSPAGFDAAYGSISALQNCTADKQRLNWAQMLQEPIIPPLQFAGLNLAYDEKFDGITLQQAQAIHCTGNSLGPGGTSWGDNGEVAFFYTTSNYVVNALQINLGYTGKMTFHQRVGSRFDPTGAKQYVMQLGQPILKDGVVLEVNWQDFGADTVVNEIFNGLMATFGADLVGGNVDDTNDCNQDGSCLTGGPASAPANGGECYMGFLPLEGLLILTDCTTNQQPTISIPIQMQQQYYLSEPYSYQASIATINAQGPTSLPRFNNSQDPKNCYVQMGMPWKDYISECVDLPGASGTTIDPVLLDAGLLGVTSPLTFNQVNESKAYAAHTHDLETYDFNIVGVNLSWIDETVEADPTGKAIVNDSDLPSVSDANQALIATWGSDLYDKGVPQNDTVSGTFSGKGSGYVYREWARLVQNDLNVQLAAAYPNNVIPAGSPGAGGTIYNHQIGDPACFVPPAAAKAAGCTGMEGLAIQVGRGFNAGDTADHCVSGTPTPICANYAAGAYFAQLFGAPGYGATVLRPGNDLSIFCQNPAGVNSGSDPLNGNCNAYELWEGALQQVQMVVGSGSLTNLPLQIADRRYYFRWYGLALIKYLKAFGQNINATAADIAAQTLDLESVFFDSQNDGGGSTYDQVEYIERTFMTDLPATYVGDAAGSATQPGAVTVPASINRNPMDFAFGGDTLAANQRNTDWAKFMYRQENAMFTAMLENKADLPGSENNVNITNLAGSQLLQQNYASYECATQWPTVTIPVTGGTAITGSWSDVCSNACPGFSSFYPLTCPTPPLLPAATPGGPQTLQLDLNGSNPGLGLGGTTPRLANYKAVWGNGAACTNPATPNTPNSQLNPTAAGNNPYNTTPCSDLNNGFAVPTGVGSVFAVGQRPAAASRLHYDGATPANPDIGTNPNTLTAYLHVPNLANPNNALQLTGTVSDILVTVPWIGSYDGVGFSIPSPGAAGATEDKFWQTEQIDFSGILETYVLDVVPWQDPITHAKDGTLTVEAIEGDDFLGEAFLCQDTGQLTTPGTGDLLGAHMYDSAASILSWITNHPGSEDSCNIVVRYSVYDNYVDAITSMSAGVQLDINTGGGYGRVVAVIAFDPALAAAP